MTETIGATRTDRPLLIGGRAVTGTQTEPVLFPYDGSEIGRVAVADDALVEQALETAAGRCRRKWLPCRPGGARRSSSRQRS